MYGEFSSEIIELLQLFALEIKDTNHVLNVRPTFAMDSDVDWLELYEDKVTL